MSPIGSAARRIVDHLKRHAPATTADIATALGVTGAAIRTQLDDLSKQGLVAGTSGRASGRGRPPISWSLTELAVDLFPDRHSDLTIELLDAIRSSLGDDGLAAVLAARDRDQLAQLREEMGSDQPLPSRVATLAAHRTAQGYMAEVVEVTVDHDGGTEADELHLIEHHCPVCDAAASCQGLCAGELQLFADALGPDAEVTRTQHLLSGDQRCVYRIRRRTDAGTSSAP